MSAAALEAPRVRRRLVVAATLALLAQVLVSIPSLLGDATVLVRHFDGPNYLVVAKTFYRPTEASPLPGYVSTPRYFAVHLPLYPAAVRAFASVAGWPAGLLLATAAFGAASAAAWAAYQHLVMPRVAAVAGILLFLFVPPRNLLYRSIGATEAPMALLVVLAALAWRKGRVGWAFTAAGLASVTRLNGVAVVAVLALFLLAEKRVREAILGSVLALLPLAATFAWQRRVLGDPMAFFSVRGSHGGLAPFGWVFDLAREGRWVDAEMILAVLLLCGLAAARLWAAGDRFESALVLSQIVICFVVRETDVARFVLPFAPFVVVLAFRDVWERRRIAAVFLAIAVPLALAYSWAAMPTNVCEPFTYRALLAFLAS